MEVRGGGGGEECCINKAFGWGLEISNGIAIIIFELYEYFKYLFAKLDSPEGLSPLRTSVTPGCPLSEENRSQEIYLY